LYTKYHRIGAGQVTDIAPGKEKRFFLKKEAKTFFPLACTPKYKSFLVLFSKKNRFLFTPP